MLGVDIARAIAIAGMIMVHFGPTPVPDSTGGMIYDVSHGRASILFVLLAGIGISYLARGGQSKTAGFTSLDLVIRGAILLPLGLWLQDLDHGVLVILQFYAMYFFFAALIVTLSTRALIGLFAAFLIAGPIAREFFERNFAHWFVADPSTLSTPIIEIARDLLVSGYYPLITWGAPLVLGMILGRMNLRNVSLRWGLAAAGIGLIVVSSILDTLVRAIFDISTYGSIASLMSDEAHSQSIVWMMDAIGASLLVLGLCLVVGDLAGRLVWPLAATGQLALTIYVGHLILLDRYTDLFRRDTVSEAAVSVGLVMLAAILLATAWRALFPVGPLEAVFRAPSMMLRRMR